MVQILLSTVNSDHRSNCRYAVVTNTEPGSSVTKYQFDPSLKNTRLFLTEVNKTVMFVVPNIYYCGHTHTHSLSLSFSVYVTLNDLGTYIFVKPVPIYDF